MRSETLRRMYPRPFGEYGDQGGGAPHRLEPNAVRTYSMGRSEVVQAATIIISSWPS